MMTAAGTIPPAKVLVLGAGVAGLQAIATARRLGAVVEAYDVRPAAAEQIRSLGAKAIELDVETADSEDEGGYARAQGDEVAARQQAALTAHVAGADVVITTAAIPGAASPRLITTPMVEAMAPGSVIVDLAAERGGNCELTEADRDVTHSGVLILGPTDLVSSSAQSASQMFSTNLLTLIRHLDDEGRLVLDMDDEITSAIVVAKGGALLQADTSS
jgi:NAD(P) transhydrogenase subunit alpha